MTVVLLSSFIASLGFGILFNIKGWNLILAGIGGSIGSVVHAACIQLGIDEVLALFLGAIAFSIFSEICSRWQRTPVTTFVICALIPLVPGGGMYRMMVQAISHNSLGALQIGMETIGNAGSLALGIIFVSTITRFLTNLRVRRSQRHIKEMQK